MRRTLYALMLVMSVASAPLAACADDASVFDGKTHVTIAPFVWVPTINGTLALRTGDLSADIAPGAYLKALTSLAFVDVELRRGKTAFLTDYVNFNLNGTPSSALALHVLPQFLTFGPSFTIVQTPALMLNVLAGARVALITARATIPSDGTLSKSGTFSDALIGIYGHVNLAKHLSLPYYADAGSGTPSFTWQGYAGVRYGRLTAAYRHLSYSGGGAILLQSLRLDGPELGYSFEL